MTIIEIKPFRNGCQVYECVGVQPVFLSEEQAIDYAKGIQTTIVLVDGEQLANLMIEFGVGVNQTGVIKLMKLDEDYFADE